MSVSTEWGLVKKLLLRRAGMQLESLKIFCDVVETGSFSRAGQLSQVSQSAVSQQIRQLETRYTQQLLSRNTRQVRMTAAGERLFRGCKDILTRLGEVESEVRDQGAGVSGTATVSTIYSIGLHEFQPMRSALAKENPRVKLVLKHARSDQVYADVILGAADLGLVAYPVARGPVQVIPFREDPLAVIMPPSHPLASKSKVPFAALTLHPFIAFDHDSPTGAGINRLFQEHGLELHPTMQMHDAETIVRAVELGLGISLLPTPTVQRQLAAKTLVARPLAEGTWTRPIGLLVSREGYLTRVAQAVLQAFQLAASGAH